MFGPPKPPIKRVKPWTVPKPKVVCDPNVCQRKVVHQSKREKAAIAASIELQRQKEYDWLVYQSRGRDHLDRVQHLTNLKEEVKHTLNAYDNDLNKKREKLKILLLMEEEALYKETVIQAQKDSEYRYVLMKERTKELRDLREKERQELCSRKQLQLYLNICPDVRPEASHAMLLESKKAQLMQIEDKKLIDYVESKREDLWNDVIRKEREMALNRAKMEQCEKKKRDECTTRFLDKQVEAKLQKKALQRELVRAEKEELDRLAAEIKEENLCKKSLEQQRKKKLKEELEAQILGHQKHLDRQHRDLDRIANVYNDHVSVILDEQKKAAVDDRARVKKETFTYLDEVRNYKNKMAKAEAMQEEFIEQDRIAQENKAALQRQKFRAWAAKLQQDTFVGREQQVKENMCKTALEKLHEAEEERLKLQIRRQQDKLEQDYVDQLHRSGRKFGAELLEQMKEKEMQEKLKKCEEKAQDFDLLEQERKAHENCLAHMSLLEKGSMSTNVFTKYIQTACECQGVDFKQKSLRLSKVEQEEYDKMWKEKYYTLGDYSKHTCH